jgi:hypothetical protein
MYELNNTVRGLGTAKLKSKYVASAGKEEI